MLVQIPFGQEKTKLLPVSIAREPLKVAHPFQGIGAFEQHCLSTLNIEKAQYVFETPIPKATCSELFTMLIHSVFALHFANKKGKNLTLCEYENLMYALVLYQRQLLKFQQVTV